MNAITSQDGQSYAMAYHAGAELSGIECFQINPLIKDYNGSACAFALGRWADEPEAASALETAVDDTDADVRAYARRALRQRVG
jgi:succinate dehydrogenase/fumarate reductase flavoprotein subunit